MVIKHIQYNSKEFLDAYLKQSPIKGCNFEEYAAAKKLEYEEINSYFTDEFVLGYFDWVKEGYSDVEINDLKPRCFEIDGVGAFMLGQRFKNGNRDYPFIILDIAFSEEKLLDVIDSIKEIAKKTFPKTKPIGLTTTLRFTEELPADAIIWNQVVYGKFDGAIATSNMRLEVSENPIDYEKYCQIYSIWSKYNPKLARFISKESEEDLLECAQAGLYFKFFVDNEFAGIICGDKDTLYGHDSIYIFEELIFEKYRGKGLAKIMQQMFHLKFSDIKYIWGHISAENQPSFKTALACNRKVLEREVFFSFS